MRSVLALGLVAVLSIAGSAQLPTSTLNGTVTDPQSAAVANAKVSIISQATGAVRETTTDTAGFYSVTNLLPADYTLRVEIPTFAKSEIKNIRLEVGRASTVDVKLAIAQVGEMVTVQAEEAQVNSTQSEVQGIVESATIENIPLNGRNFLELAFLIPGNRPATNFDPTKTNTLEVSSAGSFRHKALQALPALVRDQPAPHFAREQFGGSIGGPIKKDKAFWFVSSEYLDQGNAVQVGERDFTSDNVITTSASAFVHDYRFIARTDIKFTSKDNLEVRYGFN